MTYSDWDLVESGPAEAERTVLLLPGGMMAAGSFKEVMAQPQLAELRMVAATLPGQAGSAPPDDGHAIENHARIATELAEEIGADVVVGFSMGASVAAEMAASGLFTGPIVLTGVSLSLKAESSFFVRAVKLGRVLGGGSVVRLLTAGASSYVKQAKVSEERKAELRADFARNDPGVVGPSLRDYLTWLDDGNAQRLADSGVPTWIVHAEKGDGSLTPDERRVLEAADNVHIVTVPGAVFFLPQEAPEPIADAITEAIRASSG